MPMPKNSNDVISTITFQTLVCPAKLGVNIFQSFHDRMAQTNPLLSLATLIKERARDLPLATSWEEMSLNCPTGEQKRITAIGSMLSLVSFCTHVRDCPTTSVPILLTTPRILPLPKILR